MREAVRGQERSGRVLALLAVLAVAVRAWRWVRTDAIFADGPRFLEIAQAAGAGEWGAVFADDFHPLYPLLISLVQPLVQDWETAAALVSIAAGALSVAFLFGLVHSAFGFQPAWLAGLIFALHPRAIDFTSDVQSEGLYLAMFLGGLWAGWRLLSDPSARWAAACGALAGLAYLVRPEGLGVVGIVGALGAFEAARGRVPWRRALACGAALVFGAALVAAPYMWAMAETTGSITLTRKKSIGVLLGMENPKEKKVAVVPPPAPSAALPGLSTGKAAPPAAPETLQDGAVMLVRKSIKALRYEVVLLVAIGLWSVRGRPRLRGRFFGLLVGSYTVLLFGLVMSSGYVSRRHLLPFLIPLLGYAALGVPLLGQAFLGLLRRPALSQRVALAAGLAIVVLPAAIELGRIRAGRHLAERLAGERVAESTTTRPTIASQRRYAAYYAGGRHLPIIPSLDTLDSSRLQNRGATHVILPVEALESEVWDEVLAQPALHLVDRFEARGRTTVLISVDPAGS